MDVVFTLIVGHFAVIVVIPGKDPNDVADALHQPDRILFAEHVLVLVALCDGNRIAGIRVDRVCLA